MVRIETAATSPVGEGSKQPGQSISPDPDLVPVRISRQTLLNSVQRVQASPQSVPKDLPLVQVFIQRQAPPQPSGNPRPKYLESSSTETSSLSAIQIPLQVLRDSVQKSQTTALGDSPPDSEYVTVLAPRQLLSDSTQNNQTPPPETPPAEEIIHAVKVWWPGFVATALAGGNNLITLIKRSMIYLPGLLLFSLALPTILGLAVPHMCNLALVANHIPSCPRRSHDTKFPHDFRKLVSLQSQLEKTMDESASGSIVAVDLKRSEMAVQDLSTLVEHSTLHFKDSLVKNLDQFISDAKTTGRDLQKFSSRVGGTVDEIVLLNEYALQLLERAANEERPQIAGDLPDQIFNSLFPVAPVPPEVIAARKEEIKAVWIDMTDLMKKSIRSLIFEARLNLGALDRLDAKLISINGLLAREDNRNSKAEKELLARWSTTLGLNKEKLHDLESNNHLLEEVQQYRKAAFGHITRTMFQLEKVSLDLDDLNKRVSSPGLLGKESGIPLEGHVEAMKKGTEQLVERRKLAQEREDDYLRKMVGSG